MVKLLLFMLTINLSSSQVVKVGDPARISMTVNDAAGPITYSFSVAPSGSSSWTDAGISTGAACSTPEGQPASCVGYAIRKWDVRFNKPGTFTVTLTANDGTGTVVKTTIVQAKKKTVTLTAANDPVTTMIVQE